jgi:hypothetical protein
MAWLFPPFSTYTSASVMSSDEFLPAAKMSSVRRQNDVKSVV